MQERGASPEQMQGPSANTPTEPTGSKKQIPLFLGIIILVLLVVGAYVYNSHYREKTVIHEGGVVTNSLGQDRENSQENQVRALGFRTSDFENSFTITRDNISYPQNSEDTYKILLGQRLEDPTSDQLMTLSVSIQNSADDAAAAYTKNIDAASTWAGRTLVEQMKYPEREIDQYNGSYFVLTKALPAGETQTDYLFIAKYFDIHLLLNMSTQHPNDEASGNFLQYADLLVDRLQAENG